MPKVIVTLIRDDTEAHPWHWEAREANGHLLATTPVGEWYADKRDAIQAIRTLFGTNAAVTLEFGDETWMLRTTDTAPLPGLDTAAPEEVAAVLGTTEAGLAQMRYRGTGPKFIKLAAGRGGRVIYRWSDVRAYLDANVMQRTDDPRSR